MLNIVDKIIVKTKHKFKFIDLGGGMGISYENVSKKLNYSKYNIAIKKFLKKHSTKIIFRKFCLAHRHACWGNYIYR